MKKLIKLFLLAIFFVHVNKLIGQKPPREMPFLIFKKGMLTISENGKYIKKYEKPFLYSAFTMWNFLYEFDLNKSLHFIEIIKNKGFNVFQFSILPTDEPLYFHSPFIEGNMLKPDSTFFNFLDTIIKFANDKDLVLALSLYWNTNDKIIENKYVNNKLSISSAFKYAQWMAQRYKEYPNIIWIVGGNAIINEETYPIWEAMGSGLRSADNEHLITFLGFEGQTSVKYSSSSWLSFNSINAVTSKIDFNKLELLFMDLKNQKPEKPIMILNLPCEYPNMQKNNDSIYIKSDGIKYNIWQFFLGAAGINYSICKNICKNNELINYIISNNNLDSLIYLIKSRPWYTKEYSNNILNNANLSTEKRQIAIKGDGFCMVYLPEGGEVEINLKKVSISNDIIIYWFKLLEGKIVKIDTLKSFNKKINKFITPSSGSGNDYILLIDDLRKNFPFPGSKEYEPVIIDMNKRNMKPRIEKSQPLY